MNENGLGLLESLMATSIVAVVAVGTAGAMVEAYRYLSLEEVRTNTTSIMIQAQALLRKPSACKFNFSNLTVEMGETVPINSIDIYDGSGNKTGSLFRVGEGNVSAILIQPEVPLPGNEMMTSLNIEFADDRGARWRRSIPLWTRLGGITGNTIADCQSGLFTESDLRNTACTVSSDGLKAVNPSTGKCQYTLPTIRVTGTPFLVTCPNGYLLAPTDFPLYCAAQLPEGFVFPPGTTVTRTYPDGTTRTSNIFPTNCGKRNDTTCGCDYREGIDSTGFKAIAYCVPKDLKVSP